MSPIVEADMKCRAKIRASRCGARRREHIGDDLECPNGSGATFLRYDEAVRTVRGQNSFLYDEVELLEKIVIGTLHRRSLDAARSHPAFDRLVGRVDTLSAQVKKRRAELGL